MKITTSTEIDLSPIEIKKLIVEHLYAKHGYVVKIDDVDFSIDMVYEDFNDDYNSNKSPVFKGATCLIKTKA